MSLLLTFNQQQLIKKISSNNQTKYDPLAQDVEELELRELLGVALLQDIQNDPESTKNTVLLDGGTFTDCNNNEIKFKGLRWILAYFNYAEYVMTSYINDTFTGFVQKNRNESEKIDQGAVKKLQLRNRKLAMEEWDLLEKFLNENCTTYPLWISTESKTTFAPDFIFLRKTQG